MTIDDELDLCSSRFEPSTEMTCDFPTKVNCFDNSSTVSTMCPMSPNGRCSTVFEGSDEESFSEMDSAVDQFHTKVAANKFKLKRLARISHFSDSDSDYDSEEAAGYSDYDSDAELTEFDNSESSLVKAKSLNPSGGPADFRNGIFLENIDDLISGDKESTSSFIDVENNSSTDSYASAFAKYYRKLSNKVSTTATDRGCFSTSSCISGESRLSTYAILEGEKKNEISLFTEYTSQLALNVDSRSPKDVLTNVGKLLVLGVALSLRFCLSAVQNRLTKENN